MCALAMYFAGCELIQLRRSAAPVFGNVYRLVETCLDAYNMCDYAATTAVFVALFVGSTRQTESVTLLLLVMKLLARLRAIQMFGFLIEMVFDTLWRMRAFMGFLVIFLGTFAMVFNILLDAEDDTDVETSFTTRCWKMYLFSIMGEFNPEDFAAQPMGKFLFLLCTLVMNIVMLNLLISIIDEGHDQAVQMRGQIYRRQMLSTVIDLESVFVWPFSIYTVSRGRDGCHLNYPTCLCCRRRKLELVVIT